MGTLDSSYGVPVTTAMTTTTTSEEMTPEARRRKNVERLMKINILTDDLIPNTENFSVNTEISVLETHYIINTEMVLRTT